MAFPELCRCHKVMFYFIVHKYLTGILVIDLILKDDNLFHCVGEYILYLRRVVSVSLYSSCLLEYILHCLAVGLVCTGSMLLIW